MHKTKLKTIVRKQRNTLKNISLSTMQIEECLVAEGLFKTGMGSAWISFRLPDGKLLVAAFLLDVFCLGVKNVMLFPPTRRQEYRMMVQTMNFAETLAPVKACCLKKLVVEAAAYAESLGLRPHEDYEQALTALADIETADCETVYRFGCDGKPFYIPDPEDTPEKSARIMAELRRRCGDDGFDFLMEADIHDEDEDEDDSEMAIDDPSEAGHLLNALKLAGPFPAKIEPRIWRQLVSGRTAPSGATASVKVEEVYYSGDIGGIMCKLSFHGISAKDELHCSLTHLRPDRILPLYRDMTAYQQRRVKNLKRLEALA